jgi:hypothetical protein
MIEVVNAAFRFEMENPPEAELEAYARSLFTAWERDINSALPFDDYSLYMSVEEGSLLGKSKITVAAATFVAGVIGYGGFVQGVREVKNNAEWVADREDKPLRWSRHDSAALRKMGRLFEKVADQELTPEQASREALKLFRGHEDEPLPDSLREQLQDAFESVKLNPQQLDLPLVYVEHMPPPKPPADSKPPKREPVPQTPMPEAHGFRVEIRKDRKKGPPIVTTLHF